MLRHLIFILASISLLSSCEKAEEALVLPAPTGASHASLDLGADYERQIFFDFKTDNPVFTSNPMSWDLAFEASADGKHVFMNGGKGVFVYNTNLEDIRSVTGLPALLKPSGTGWQYDASCGLPDFTGIGKWYNYGGDSKGEVYIVRTALDVNQKMRILSANSTGYTIEWAPLESTGAPVTVQLTKDPDYNYIYFSFTDGVVKPEPPKDTWDVVFTRYRPLVYDNSTKQSVPYVATGVLLNPSNTRATADSTMTFAEITLQIASALPTSDSRDVIGYDWKTIDITSPLPRYTVNRAKNYILHTQKGEIYKLRFLDYYNSSGIKGNPLFEYVRLQ